MLKYILPLLLLASCTTNKTADKKIDTPDSVLAVDSSHIKANVEKEKSTYCWNYEDAKDPMTDKVVRFATLGSNSSYLETDLSIATGFITVRDHPKWGIDVMISVRGSFIYGSEINGNNYVTVRFDNTKAKRYYFSEAGDGDSHTVFLNSPGDFISRSKKSKRILIEIPLYQGGRPVFIFETTKELIWK